MIHFTGVLWIQKSKTEKFGGEKYALSESQIIKKLKDSGITFSKKKLIKKNTLKRNSIFLADKFEVKGTFKFKKEINQKWLAKEMLASEAANSLPYDSYFPFTNLKIISL